MTLKFVSVAPQMSIKQVQWKGLRVEMYRCMKISLTMSLSFLMLMNSGNFERQQSASCDNLEMLVPYSVAVIASISKINIDRPTYILSPTFSTNDINAVIFHWSLHFQSYTSKSIGDSALIGLECENGEISDCNESLTMHHENNDTVVPDGCEGFLIFSENLSSCGSLCSPSQTSRASKSAVMSGWTMYAR